MATLKKLLCWAGIIDDPGTCHDIAGVRVIARAFPRARHLRKLAASGTKLVINLTSRRHSQTLLDELGLTELHLPVRDFAAPSLDQVREAWTALRQCNRPTVVHCGGGYGRTGALLACLYVVAEGLSADEAIHRVRSERPGAIETRAQRERIYEFQRASTARDSVAE